MLTGRFGGPDGSSGFTHPFFIRISPQASTKDTITEKAPKPTTHRPKGWSLYPWCLGCVCLSMVAWVMMESFALPKKEWGASRCSGTSGSGLSAERKRLQIPQCARKQQMGSITLSLLHSTFLSQIGYHYVCSPGEEQRRQKEASLPRTQYQRLNRIKDSQSCFQEADSTPPSEHCWLWQIPEMICCWP